MPENLDWDYCAVAGGWSISMFSTDRATADKYGRITGSTPQVAVNLKSNTISFTFPATTIGKPNSLEGINIYITTWDGGGEGDLRPLKSEAEAYSFGGGSDKDSKIMDDILIRLK
jgi:carbohydrate-binding DOMON domain-containing protein